VIGISRYPTLNLFFIGLLGAGTNPRALAGQSPDSSVRNIAALIASLPPAAVVRLSMSGDRTSGRVVSRTADSLVVQHETGRRSVAIAAIDSLWVPARRHRGLLAGAGFGAVMFGVLQLSGESAEDPGLNTKLGLMFIAGSTAFGLILDAVSDPWSRRYP
jgi:hypothetical protein